RRVWPSPMIRQESAGRRQRHGARLTAPRWRGYNPLPAEPPSAPAIILTYKESRAAMRERDREIKRRRHRQEKRKRLRAKLAKANDAERSKVEAQIRKTFPKYTPQV